MVRSKQIERQFGAKLVGMKPRRGCVLLWCVCHVNSSLELKGAGGREISGSDALLLITARGSEVRAGGESESLFFPLYRSARTPTRQTASVR